MRTLLALLFSAASALAQTAVVPARHGSSDGNSHVLIGGFNLDARHQVLIDEAILRPALINRTLRGLAVRRDAAFEEPIVGGEADLTITLSIARHTALEASEEFSSNLDPANQVEVFRGRVTLPDSPASAGRTISWSDPQDVVDIRFTAPFTYTGGTLVVDIVGRPTPGRESAYWAVDAIAESVSGAVSVVGEACGPFRGRSGPTEPYTSFNVSPLELVPGVSARFLARGERNHAGAFLLGFTPASIDLFALGIGGPNCKLYVLDAFAVAAPFRDETQFGVPWGSPQIPIQIPVEEALLGAMFRTQFVQIGTTIYTSNALDCAIAGRMPALGMATVIANFHGRAMTSRGRVNTWLAPVLQFRF